MLRELSDHQGQWLRWIKYQDGFDGSTGTSTRTSYNLARLPRSNVAQQRGCAVRLSAGLYVKYPFNLPLLRCQLRILQEEEKKRRKHVAGRVDRA